MRRRFVIGVVSVLCFVCSLLCSIRWGYPALLTLFYGRELEQALQYYWDVMRSREAFEDPTRLSEVATGNLLTTTMRLYSAFNGPPTDSYTCQVTHTSVKEYSSECSRVSAQVVCGSGWGAFTGNSGQYISLREEGQWKVVNRWRWHDTHITSRPPPPPTCKDFLEQ
jgi:hypothetical protein